MGMSKDEIKELKFCIKEGNTAGYYINDIVDKIDELVRAVNEIRKELNK